MPIIIFQLYSLSSLPRKFIFPIQLYANWGSNNNRNRMRVPDKDLRSAFNNHSGVKNNEKEPVTKITKEEL